MNICWKHKTNTPSFGNEGRGNSHHCAGYLIMADSFLTAFAAHSLCRSFSESGFTEAL